MAASVAHVTHVVLDPHVGVIWSSSVPFIFIMIFISLMACGSSGIGVGSELPALHALGAHQLARPNACAPTNLVGQRRLCPRLEHTAPLHRDLPADTSLHELRRIDGLTTELP